jgi:predicted nucleic acid-binding protein
MIFVDASYLVAFANPADVLHARARAWSGVIDESLLTTDFVLCEFVNLLSKAKDRRRAAATLNWFNSVVGAQRVAASRALFDAGLFLHEQRPDKEWSLTDCISFHVMQQHAITRALTHDHHFEQAGFDAILRRDPSA